MSKLLLAAAAQKAENVLRAASVPVEIIAAKNEDGTPKLPTFRMVAYTGATMDIWGWGAKVVVDLAGVKIPDKTRPILKDHDPRVVTGHTTAITVDNEIIVEGVLSGANAETQEIIASSKNGFPWQASIGAKVLVREFVEAGATAAVNGREFAGPVEIVRECELFEISFVALGADDNTNVSVAASRRVAGDKTQKIKGEKAMTFEEWAKKNGHDLSELSEEEIAELRKQYEEETKEDDNAEAKAKGADLLAERKRVGAIMAAFGGQFHKEMQTAITAGHTVEQAQATALRLIRAARPSNDVQVTVKASNTNEAKVLEAALSLRAGLNRDKLESDLGADVVKAAQGGRGISLKELFLHAARNEGHDVSFAFGDATIRAGFSTVAIPTILNNVANKKLLESFQAASGTAEILCSIGDLADFKQATRVRLVDVGNLVPVAPDGELSHGSLGEDVAYNQLETYGKLLQLSRQNIYNDDLNSFLKIASNFGQRAAALKDKLFYTRLVSNPTFNGGALFSDGRGNYAEGANSALSVESVQAAIGMLRRQKDSDGQPIFVRPFALVVPPELEFAAKAIATSAALIATGTSSKLLPMANVIVNEGLQVVVSPYLTDAKAWYLWGDPASVDTFELGFLQGQRTPTIEAAEADFTQLGMRWRVFYDLGVRELDWRGFVNMKGQQ